MNLFNGKNEQDWSFSFLFISNHFQICSLFMNEIYSFEIERFQNFRCGARFQKRDLAARSSN